jgi:hypothetical protein
MRCLYLCIFIIVNSALLFAQQSELQFKVIEEGTKTPVQFCFVIVKGTTISSQSDESGNVKIKANNVDTLIVYQLGYFMKKQSMADITGNGYTVQLKLKSVNLNEVVITTQKTQILQATNNTFFLAFEFYDDFILALADKGERYNSLMLMDMAGNKIAEKKLHIKTESLFKDCLGNIHLLTEDSIHQVYYNYKDVTLLKPFHISNYYNTLKPCECYSGHKYIFKIRQYRNLKNAYYMIDDEIKANNQWIITVADSAAIKGFNTDFDINYFLEQRRRGVGYFTNISELKKNIDYLREELILSENYNNLIRPVNSEMKKTDSAFVLLDYTNKQIYHFSLEGKQKDCLSLNNSVNISPKMIYDDDYKQMIFSQTNKKGIVTLYRFDLKSNTFTHKFEIKKFYFISDFKIKGGNLYFIYKDRQSSLTQSKIIKESIFWEAI